MNSFVWFLGKEEWIIRSHQPGGKKKTGGTLEVIYSFLLVVQGCTACLIDRSVC